MTRWLGRLRAAPTRWLATAATAVALLAGALTLAPSATADEPALPEETTAAVVSAVDRAHDVARAPRPVIASLETPAPAAVPLVRRDEPPVSPAPLSPVEIINEIFGSAAPAAIAVARCESTLNPAAMSAGGGNHGLFQINNVHSGRFESVTGSPWSARYDARANTLYAKWLYDRSGWGPWACKRVL